MAFRQTVDDLLFRSNTHHCTTNRNKNGSKNQSRSFTGCLDNVFGKCKACFPRPVVETTYIDETIGHIHLRKKAQWINTFSYLVTYLFRCNTDVTSLKSGTTIKGVLLYVTNYITKPTLKTHVIFDTIRSVFLKNTEIVSGSESRQQIARKLMTKIVNSLSVKMEHGCYIHNTTSDSDGFRTGISATGSTIIHISLPFHFQYPPVFSHSCLFTTFHHCSHTRIL
jgi:hypothetical protein